MTKVHKQGEAPRCKFCNIKFDDNEKGREKARDHAKANHNIAQILSRGEKKKNCVYTFCSASRSEQHMLDTHYKTVHNIKKHEDKCEDGDANCQIVVKDVFGRIIPDNEGPTSVNIVLAFKFFPERELVEGFLTDVQQANKICRELKLLIRRGDITKEVEENFENPKKLETIRDILESFRSEETIIKDSAEMFKRALVRSKGVGLEWIPIFSKNFKMSYIGGTDELDC